MLNNSFFNTLMLDEICQWMIRRPTGLVNTSFNSDTPGHDHLRRVLYVLCIAAMRQPALISTQIHTKLVTKTRLSASAFMLK